MQDLIAYILKFKKLRQSKQHAFKGLDDYQHSNVIHIQQLVEYTKSGFHFILTQQSDTGLEYYVL